jgi:four helix bundle protein
LYFRILSATLFYNTFGGIASLILHILGAVDMREPAKTFEDLLVWQKAHSFVIAVYHITASFPKHELYGLTSQFRCAAVSIAANIAEGFRKRSDLDKVRFFNIAQGSVEECRYYLILSKDLGYDVSPDANPLLNEVSKLLGAYSRSIQKSD